VLGVHQHYSWKGILCSEKTYLKEQSVL
jgi:hypothetical protein